MDDKKAEIADSYPKELNRNLAHLFIISAPSGAGKTTLSRAVLQRFDDILYSVSYTTRESRSGEQDGIDYHFISKSEFRKRIKNDKWAEWAEVHGNFYGTSAEFMDEGLTAGHDILLDIDVQGTLQILNRYPNSITIFILPPSLDTLKNRLESRGTDSTEAIERRLKEAEKELARKDFYRHVVVNDQLSETIEELVSIIESYRTTKKTEM